MTTQNPYQDGQEPAADLVRSLALSSAKLWEELFERLHRIEVAQTELREVLAKLDIGLPPSQTSPAIGSAGGTQGELPAASSFEEALATAGSGVEDYLGHSVHAGQADRGEGDPGTSVTHDALGGAVQAPSFEWHAGDTESTAPPAVWGAPAGVFGEQHSGSFSSSDEAEEYDEVELTVPPPPPPSPTVIFESPASVTFEAASTVTFEAPSNGFVPPPPPSGSGSVPPPSNGSASAPPPPPPDGFASIAPPPPPPDGFASAPPPPPPGFGMVHAAAPQSDPAPPPPPPGFAAAATPPPPPPGFGIAPPPPPAEYTRTDAEEPTAPQPATTSGGARSNGSGPSANGHRVEHGDSQQPFAITPDFFARAGRRRV